MAGFRLIFAPLLASTVFSMSTLAQAQTPTNDANHASVQMEQRQEHIHGGSEIAVRIKLNEPLPAGAHFDLRLSPVSVNQELSVSSGESTLR